MSEMIERVARAIAPDDFDSLPGHEQGKCPDCDSNRDEARRIVRTVIEAMLEPTDAMCEAGYGAGTGDWGGRYDNRRELARGRIEPGWKAMIGAALQRCP